VDVLVENIGSSGSREVREDGEFRVGRIRRDESADESILRKRQRTEANAPIREARRRSWSEYRAGRNRDSFRIRYGERAVHGSFSFASADSRSFPLSGQD